MVPSFTWKQEPRKKGPGLSSVDCELQVSSDFTALGPGQERTRANRKAASGAGAALGGLSAQVGDWDPESEKNNGVKVS